MIPDLYQEMYDAEQEVARMRHTLVRLINLPQDKFDNAPDPRKQEIVYDDVILWYEYTLKHYYHLINNKPQKDTELVEQLLELFESNGSFCEREDILERVKDLLTIHNIVRKHFERIDSD